MKEHSSNQKKTVSKANANQSFFQNNSEKEPFFKPKGSENGFFNKRTPFFSTPIQRKTNNKIPKELQTNIEQSLGQDFSNVNIKKNSQEAVDLNARAFTKGDSIHFAPNELNPNTNKGKELIGHEFAHVAQQRTNAIAPSIQQKGQIINDDPKLEQEADDFGKSLTKDNNFINTQKNVETKSISSNVVQRQIPEKSSDVTEISLIPGISYTITSEDMSQGSEDVIWDYLARKNGMLSEKLKLFNQQIKSVQFLGFTVFSYPEVLTLSEGTVIYIPSADELAFLAYRENFSTYEKTVQEFGDFINTSNQSIIQSARKRASDELGTSYGTNSDTFFTPNKSLAGASSRRSEVIEGQTEYKVNWGSDLWKCNIYMHDVVYDAGYVPHMSSNKHYITAGKLHDSTKYNQLKISEAKPGSLVQLFGGTGSNASHNMVLSSFVKKTDNGDGTEHWVFSAIGAESDSSAESIREFDINPDESTDFYKVTSGGRDYVRFFEPKNQR